MGHRAASAPASVSYFGWVTVHCDVDQSPFHDSHIRRRLQRQNFHAIITIVEIAQHVIVFALAFAMVESPSNIRRYIALLGWFEAFAARNNATSMRALAIKPAQTNRSITIPIFIIDTAGLCAICCKAAVNDVKLNRLANIPHLIPANSWQRSMCSSTNEATAVSGMVLARTSRLWSAAVFARCVVCPRQGFAERRCGGAIKDLRLRA